MNNEILDALSQITREKSVDRAMLIETLEQGLASAVRKKHGATADVEVRFNDRTGGLECSLRMTVVENVEDPAFQWTVEKARTHKPDAVVGDVVLIPLPISEFGRNAIQTAKQVLIQRVREAERDRVFKEYSDKIGTLVRGVVQQVDRGNVIVKLEFSEGFLPAREQIPRSYHRQGDYVRAVVINVDKSAKGPQVILSRTHPDFLKRLFEAEVPEIADGIVEVRAVSREAGARSKISVYSTDPRVDAVGSCVGLKGSRVQSIVRELGGERIDIVPWSPDPERFARLALAPARVARVFSDPDTKTIQAIVDEDQLSLAIGRNGQNVRLASELTGWKIDLYSSREWLERGGERPLFAPLPPAASGEAEGEGEDVASVQLAELGGITQDLLAVLDGAGYTTFSDILDLEPDEVRAIPGMAPEMADRLLTLIDELTTTDAQTDAAPEASKPDAPAAEAPAEPGSGEEPAA